MKLALVTGSSSGIGKSTVIDLLNTGWTVIASMRKSERGQEIFKNEIQQFGVQLDIQELDVVSEGDMNKMVQLIDERYNQKLDLLVNNAGYGLYSTLEEATPEQIRNQMEVNFFGTTFLTKKLLPSIRRAKGRVMIISSIMGNTSMPLSSLYSASKYALEGLAEGLYFELKGFGVEVCTILPGGHRTNFTKSIVKPAEEIEVNGYTEMNSSFNKLMNKLSTKKDFVGPENVSKYVVKLTHKKSLPRKVVVGSDANALYMLKSFLPEFAYFRLMSFFLGKVFRAS